MPTYDYMCEKCGHTCEVSQKITEDPLINCPACTLPYLKRGIGGGYATFRFMGEGFYITDYKKECQKNETSSCCPCKNNEKE